jgi:glycosyltransferase involved in cell wall biosynthesis
LKVSVVIPTYNRSAQVLRALDCVFAQTAPVHEVIVVDDGSTDGTAENIQSQHGLRVRVVRQHNRGVSAARNRGICEARGEWVAFLDSDDIWLSTKIQDQLHAIAVTDDRAGLCFTDNFFEGDANRKLSRFEEVGFHASAQFGVLDEPPKLILQNREPLFTSSVMVRRSLFEDIPGFDEGMSIGEDTDLFFRLSFRTSFCYVARTLVGIDRTPTRELGLCNLYFTRNDQK